MNWGDNWVGAHLLQSIDLQAYTLQPTISYKFWNKLSVCLLYTSTAEYMRNIGESRIYVVPKLSTENEQWVNPDFGTTELRTHYDNIKRMVKEKTGRAMQEKEMCIRDRLRAVPWVY